MRSTTKRLMGLSTAMVLAATSACTQPEAAAKPLPQGEDALSCGALIYAATSYAKSDEHKPDFDTLKSIAATTKYATAYAAPEGMDAQEALARIKIKALRYSGTPSGNADELPTADLVQRANACAAAA